MFIKHLFLFLLFPLIIFHYCQSKVIMIQAIIRHADRNPYQGPIQSWYYPKDPYKDYDFSPEGPMELNQAGKKNAFNFGIFLRNEYQTLIGSSYNPRHIYFEAIKSNRTIATAQLIAAGLFPPSSEEAWNSQLAWIPVPIHSVLWEQDPKMAMTFCENFNLDRRRANTEVRGVLQVLSDVQDLFRYLSFNTGANYSVVTQGWLLYHQLASQANLGLELESWTSSVYPNGKLVDISAVEYILQTYTTRMKRLMGGIWIKMFLDQVDELIINKTKSHIKGSFCVGTEINIAAILNTLGVYKAHIPDYLSTVIFELHEIDEDYYVKVIYKNKGKIEEIEIPGCESFLCLLSTFRIVLDKVTLKDFDADCGKRGSFSIIEILNFD